MLAELSFLHASYLVQDVRMADIRLASLVYSPCLRLHVLRAYCTFGSKQAVPITLFGPRPNNEGSEKNVNEYAYDISSKKRVTKNFLEVSRCSRVNQRQRNVQNLHKKRVQLPQDWSGTETWPPFHCFGTQMWSP